MQRFGRNVARRMIGQWGAPVACALVVFAGSAAIPVQAQAPGNATASTDASVESLFADFLHYARIGRFSLADSYAKKLLAHPDLDPVIVMEKAHQDRKSLDTLLILVENSTLGESAAEVIELIKKGEYLKRQDPERIRANIQKLGGNPQQEFFAIRNLADSGEYAIPPMIQTLLDVGKKKLWSRVVVALTKMGKPAVRPLAMALRTQSDDARLHIVHALGEIGYPQAIPYLSKMTADENLSNETREAAGIAIERIHELSGRRIAGSTAELFYWLGERFYAEEDAVRADPRLSSANVWYWDDATQVLKAVTVPQKIFGTVMAMRCAEESLNLRNDYAEAIALWLAGNIRRENRLGVNVESGDPAEQGELDATRPTPFPRALYFSQAAGPRYAHLVLNRAIRDNDTAVALGAIEALRITAGESSLVGSEDAKQPLVQALRFPDLIVRLRASLALGAALPKTPFADSQYVVPHLATAITLTGDEQVVVVDADKQNLNRVMDALRQDGKTVIGETSYYRAMERVRSEFHAVSALFVSTDVTEPDIASAVLQFRSQFLYAKSPIVILSKQGQELVADDLAAGDRFASKLHASADSATLTAALARMQSATGRSSIDNDLALSLAIQAVETLRKIAEDGQTVFSFDESEAALVAALHAEDEGLRIKAASVLALSATSSAQQAIAAIAMDENNSVTLRVSTFNSLAESGKRNGLLLEEGEVDALVTIARDDADLTIRTAASESLGAINIQSNQASSIIRSYHGG